MYQNVKLSEWAVCEVFLLVVEALSPSYYITVWRLLRGYHLMGSVLFHCMQFPPLVLTFSLFCKLTLHLIEFDRDCGYLDIMWGCSILAIGDFPNNESTWCMQLLQSRTSKLQLMSKCTIRHYHTFFFYRKYSHSEICKTFDQIIREDWSHVAIRQGKWEHIMFSNYFRRYPCRYPQLSFRFCPRSAYRFCAFQ